MNRLQNSSPALDAEDEVDNTTGKPLFRRNKRWQRRGDEELTFTVSAIYAKILVIVGIALPLTKAISRKDSRPYEEFYVFLYVTSVIFLVYMYIVHLRQKSVQEGFRNSFEDRRNSDDSIIIKTKSYNRYGSFYFRMGVMGFGIGTTIYSVLQYGEYLEDCYNDACFTWMKSVKPLSRIAFILLQMLFIFSYSNFLDVQRSKFIAKFGLMHMIATNICDWFYILVEETQFDIYNSRRLKIMSKANNTLPESHTPFVDLLYIRQGSGRKEQGMLMHSVLLKAAPYLEPCAVEYNLLCSVILLLIWKNNCSGNSETVAVSDSKEMPTGPRLVYNRSHSQYSVDCAQAHKGLFSGLLVLAVTSISLILFFEMVSAKNTRDVAALQMNIWEAVLFCLGIVAVILCLLTLRKLDLKTKKKDLEVELEHLLLLVTQWGVFMYFLFQIIGGVQMVQERDTDDFMRVITPLSALVQSCCQTILILDAWKRRCLTKWHMKQKPGRQLITFLLILNIALWIVNRLKNNHSLSHPKQMEFYGILAWNIITHMSMPMVVTYRFQSTVCFYEIWKRVYKNKPLKDDKCNNG